ncbi:helix-turn-helix transcriptional regulator [Catellatospora sp. TT07R-123]|uniref:helix-turn-helix domain-containing protein n=1 Tax=Catellatospora sp. TT07R-123 TaxID=2733863 RepID=UPI001FD28AC5|nr:helix-turn-helix transcriptional regulator [Catellatospora sp. TT07R-123]
MVDHPLWGVEDLAAHMQLSEAAVRDALDVLAERALVQPRAQDTGGMRVVSPQAGLTMLLAQAEADIAQRQRQIEVARATISAIATEHDKVRRRDEIIRLEGSSAVRGRLMELAPAVQKECLTFTARAELTAEAIDAGRPLNQLLLERGVSIRNVYQESVRNDPTMFAFAKWMASKGGRSRTVPSVPMRLIIIDRRVAIIPIDPADSTRGALEIRSPGVIAALCILFEQVWDFATPFGESPKSDDRGLTPQEQALMRLLDAGHTDESAGRKIGLSARTVRRIVSELADRLGVESRFQAGAEAVRRGWL